MTTTERAIMKLKGILVQKCTDMGLGFRVIKDKDEAGYTIYDIKIDTEHPGDEIIKSNGIKILLDTETAAFLSDNELDYTEDPASGSAFKILDKSNKN